ncbi:MAG: hypothetical protein AB1505_29215, partial [Candidatus Latescibacterota bacterium]
MRRAIAALLCVPLAVSMGEAAVAALEPRASHLTSKGNEQVGGPVETTAHSLAPTAKGTAAVSKPTNVLYGVKQRLPGGGKALLCPGWEGDRAWPRSAGWRRHGQPSLGRP